MAKDDFFVIAYRILAYLYACMKSGVLPDEDEISFEKLGIHERYWVSIIDNLYKKGYIDGVQYVTVLGSDRQIALRDPEITMDGIEFLQNNSTLANAKKFLKELKEIIPGI